MAKTLRQAQLERAKQKLLLRAKIETNRDLIKRKQMEIRALRAQVKEV